MNGGGGGGGGTDAGPSSSSSSSSPSNLFRKWSPHANPKGDPEIQQLQAQVDKARGEVQQLRDYGKQVRMRRLHSLDALETRRVTLTEILRQFEKELFEKDVYEYADVLAEVFGERKIFAHRAIGLEALLCQFMHQMLAKQHQLKIIKKAAKDIQNMYQKRKAHLRDEFYSFEALAVQLEASRLTLEALYEDVFTMQHRLLARLLDIEAGGTGDAPNMALVPASPVLKHKASLRISTREIVDEVQDQDVDTPGAEHDDYEAAMDILSESTGLQGFSDRYNEEKKDHDSNVNTNNELNDFPGRNSKRGFVL